MCPAEYSEGSRTSNTNGFGFSFSLACKVDTSILGTGGPNNLLRKLMIHPFCDYPFLDAAQGKRLQSELKTWRTMCT